MLVTQVYGFAEAKQVGRRNFVGRVCGTFRQALHKATALCLITALSVPTLPASQAQASAMALLGTLDISKTGAATYGLDISVPPGTGGMIPSLSLQYNSQAGNSTLGMGWSVAGLSGVSWCPKNLATDGERGAVNFDGDDRFCLEGQHLIVVSGAYGADGAEYRTEIEGFSRIYSHGTAGNGPAWFEVQTKSGQTMDYGNTVDSRALAQGTTTARVWAVNKIEDTVGNYLTYTYVNDTTNGQLYPTRIDYTANDAEGLSAYNSVRFSYEARPDIVPLYLGGSLMKSTTRLTNVKTYVGEAVVADYQMTYELSPATGRSRLTDLDLCTGAGVCLPGIGFEYSGIAFTSGTDDNGTLHLNPSSTDGSYGKSFIYPVELNGDGKTNLIVAPYDQNGIKGNTVQVWESTATTALDPSIFTVTTSTQAMVDDYTPHPGHFNGDGLTDILLFDEDETDALKSCILRTGTARWFLYLKRRWNTVELWRCKFDRM